MFDLSDRRVERLSLRIDHAIETSDEPKPSVLASSDQYIVIADQLASNHGVAHDYHGISVWAQRLSNPREALRHVSLKVGLSLSLGG